MKQGKNSAFTLIEVLLVVIILGILAAMTFPRLTGKTDQAKFAAAKTEIEGSISLALEMYELDNGSFPSASQGLKALIEKPTTTPEPVAWNGPYLKKRRVPKDPWNRDYTYEAPGKNNPDYDISSTGPDGVSGNEDDINNWDSGDEES